MHDNGISILFPAYGINSNETLSDAYTLSSEREKATPHSPLPFPLFCMHMSTVGTRPILRTGCESSHKILLKKRGGRGGFKSRGVLSPHFLIHITFLIPPHLADERFIHIFGVSYIWYFHALALIFAFFFIPPSIITRRGLTIYWRICNPFFLYRKFPPPSDCSEAS